MEYRESSKNRRFRARVVYVFNKLTFRFLNLPQGLRLSFFGIVIVFLSLFFPWFSITDEKTLSGNAFSAPIGYVGYFLALGLLGAIFVLFSGKSKEKITSYLPFSLEDDVYLCFSGVMVTILSIITIGTIGGFTTFYKDVSLGGATIFALIGGVFLGSGGVIHAYLQKKDAIKKLYVDNASTQHDEEMDIYREILNGAPPKKDKNMSLPI